MICTSVPVALTTPYTFHIRLPDRHNIASHFHSQAFLSEQVFPVCLCLVFLHLFCCFS